jgi:hypothetical protein
MLLCCRWIINTSLLILLSAESMCLLFSDFACISLGAPHSYQLAYRIATRNHTLGRTVANLVNCLYMFLIKSGVSKTCFAKLATSLSSVSYCVH